VNVIEANWEGVAGGPTSIVPGTVANRMLCVARRPLQTYSQPENYRLLSSTGCPPAAAAEQ